MDNKVEDNPDIIISLGKEEIPEKVEEKVKYNDKTNNNNGLSDIKNNIYESLGIKDANKPFVCFIHICFKILIILSYILGSLLMNNMTLFLLIIIFSVFDFWLVKNITGRLLVSLRWWRIIDENGIEKWIFENDKSDEINKIDKNIFWYSQIGLFLFWVLVFVIKLISFNLFWAILGFISILLCGTNLYGYYKCSKEFIDNNTNINKNINLLKYIPKFISK